MKLCILVAYKFLIKNKFWGQSVHFWSCDVTKLNLEFIRLAITQPFLKIETSGLDKKNSIKLCAERCNTVGVMKCISGHVTGQRIF